MAFGDWIRRARFWLQRHRLSDELDEEMRLHVELRARQLREQGRAADAADLAARRQFGNPLALREAGRDAWGFGSLERLAHDLRSGWRQLTARRGVTVIAIVTLALGIGANTALFTVVNAILLKPPPVADPDQLVWIGSTRATSSGMRPLSYPDYLTYQGATEVFTGAVAYATTQVSVGGEHPERLRAMVVSSNYFDVLGVRAEVGRTFSPADIAASGPHLALLGEGYWRRRHGTAAVVGQQLRVNGTPFVIAGVLPEGFGGLEMSDTELPAVWVPSEAVSIAMPDVTHLLADASAAWWAVAARLRPGVAMAQAEAAVAAMAAHAPSAATPGATGPAGEMRSATVAPVRGGLHPRDQADVAPVLWLLMIVPALVLVVACANVGNLLLAQGVARRKELALRRAIGATRSRLVRQLVTESLLVALAGAGLAMLVAVGFIRLIGALGDVPAPIFDALQPDARVFLWTLAAGVASVLMFGVSPALSSTSTPPSAAIASGDVVVDVRGRRRRLRSAFVVIQVAVSMTLLIAAGLMLQSLGKALRADPGFDAASVITFSYDLGLQQYSPARGALFHDALLARLRAIPGITGVAVARPAPISGETFRTEMSGDAGDGSNMVVDYARISPGYFDVLGVPLAAGRDFSSLDGPGAPPVAIVNERLARQIAPDGRVLGRRVRVADTGEPWRVIVGIARDLPSASVTDRPQPFLYLAWTQQPLLAPAIVMRAADAAAVTPRIPEIVRALDPDLPVYRLARLEETVARSFGAQRAAASVLAVFGGLALLLATLGIYGVTAHRVTLRTREIGVRIALGARPRQVLRLFVGEGLRLSTIGVCVGVGIGVLASGVLESFLFGVRATDPVTFAGVALALTVVAMLASLVPARRAATLDPLRALRHE